MSDAQMDVLSRQWRGLAANHAVSATTALRRRHRQRAVLLLEVLGSGAMYAFALCFWLAGSGVVLRAAAAMFVAAGTLTLVVALRTRTLLGRWSDWTPEGVLAFRLRECEVALLNARYGFVALAGLIVFASFVWMAAELAWDSLPLGFHHLYASCVAISAVLTALWSTWRIRVKRRERQRLWVLMQEFRNA
jgi:hypothetical protein